MIKNPILGIVLFAFVMGEAIAQQPPALDYRDEAAMPAGAAGARIQSLIAVLNSGDPEPVRRFVEEAFTERFRNAVPMERHLEILVDIRRLTGGLEFHSIRTYVPARPEETVVILKDRNFGAWRGLVIRFDDSGRYLIDGLRYSDARTPTDVTEPALTEAQLIETTREIVKRVCSNDAFSGAVLLARGKQVLLSEACGEASKSFHAANRIDTKFNLGSMNKMFTATAVAQLVERGVLSFSDPISKYIDESWLPREITDKVTVHHLLSHTSGLGSYFNDTFWNGSRAVYRDIDDFKPLLRDEKLAFEPGENYRYSNTGMLLLGVVIEKASGQDYFDYIRENIYKPAGMTNSDSYEMDRPVENLAIGYVPDPASEHGWRNNLFMHVIKGGPAGGGFSTVVDLHRFALALLDGKLMSKPSRDLLWRDHSGSGYGYGFGLTQGPGGLVVGHGGGFPGINGDLAIFVDSGYVVAVLSNYSQGANPLSGRIQELIRRIG